MVPGPDVDAIKVLLGGEETKEVKTREKVQSLKGPAFISEERHKQHSHNICPEYIFLPPLRRSQGTSTWGLKVGKESKSIPRRNEGV